MSLGGLVLLAAVAIVSDGKPVVRLEHDDSVAARAAAEILQRHIVLIAKTALPAQGPAIALRFETNTTDGYRIVERDGGVTVSGRYPVLAAYDLLRDWGCRFGGAAPHVPSATDLAIQPRVWTNSRPLVIEGGRFDASVPATAWAVRGLAGYPRPDRDRILALGYALRVASTSFDEFLPPALFAAHPAWFALRRGERAARGNFALTNAAARKAYLDHVEEWLLAHPRVSVLGLWPEVTSVWCEESIALGHAEAYALLWREAAARFPKRRFEILATGATLKPPAGRVPENVEVRLRPGRDASGLQAIAGQPMAAIVRAWEVRGARVILEIDAAPASWCGLPWPCHDAVRDDAERFAGAVLVHPDSVLAELWHRPRSRVAVTEEMARLLERARTIRSWGDPRESVRLWPGPRKPGEFLGPRVADLERTLARALRTDLSVPVRTAAATEAWFSYRALLPDLGPIHGPSYRRQRERDFRAMLESLLPDGAEQRVGGATVRESFDRVAVENARLRIVIERRTGTVVELRRRLARAWSDNLAGDSGRMFAVVGLGAKIDRREGEVRVTALADGGVRVELSGRLHRGGPKWRSELSFDDSSARIRQEAFVGSPGGVAVGCRFPPAVFDEWVCPTYAREGRFTHPDKPRQASFRLVPQSMLYCRKAPRGIGVALRMPYGGVTAIVDDENSSILSTTTKNRIKVEWIVFTHEGELGR